MKILVVSQYFWPESFHINQTVLSLKNNGHQVDVVTGLPNYPAGSLYPGYCFWNIFKYECWNDVSIYRMPILTRGKSSKIKLALNYLSFILSTLIFAPFVLYSKKYDVIFVYAPSPVFQAIPASFIGWLKKVPVVLWVQDLWPESVAATNYIHSDYLLKLIKYFVKFTYKHVDLILVQSNAFIPHVKAISQQSNICYHPNSDYIHQQPPKKFPLKNFDSSDSSFTVLFAGNVGIAQSVETVISAAKKLLNYPEVKIVILGHGSRFDWAQLQSSKLKLTNIFFKGYQPVESMSYLFCVASALLITLRDNEVLNLTIPSRLQAFLAAGKPIVASLNGEAARIIREANAGLVVPAGDSDALADAIIKLFIMSKLELERLGSNGRHYYNLHFDETTLLKKLEQHLYSVIKEDLL